MKNSKSSSRRDFLKLAGFTSAALALSACGVSPTALPAAPAAAQPRPTPTSLSPTVQRLIQQVAEWQSAGSLVHAGGLEEADFKPDSTIDPQGAEAVTVLDDRRFRRIRQAGSIFAARVQVHGTTPAGQFKFKVMRRSGDVFDLAGESEYFDIPAGTGEPLTLTFTFANPIPCEVGDCFGYTALVSGGSLPKIAWKTDPDGLARFTFADAQSGSNFADRLPFAPCIEALTSRPYLAITGDSIAIGYPENTGIYDPGPQDVTHDPGRQLELLLPGLRTQNFGSGGKSWDWVVTTSLVPALAVQPHTLIVHAGVNNALQDIPWSYEQKCMELVKAACDKAGVTLVVDEITPMTNKPDKASQSMRAFNAHFAEWCAANLVRLVRLHDEFGQLRSSTGQLDDLLAAYQSPDMGHFNMAGKQRQALRWLEALSDPNPA